MTYLEEIIIPILSMQITQIQAVVNILLTMYLIFFSKHEWKKSLMIGGLIASFGIATFSFWVYNASGYLGAFVNIPWDGWFLIQAIENLILILILLPHLKSNSSNEKWVALQKK